MIRSILFFTFLFNLGIGYGQQIQHPDAFLPHRIGDEFTPHHLLVDYYQYVAQNSERMQLIEYGQTYEGRPQLLAFVSTPENLQKLEKIRTQNVLRTSGDEVVDEDLGNIAIVWLSFNVHGNEAAGSESSMPVLHQLVTTERAEEWLANTIVILDPCINPDGYSRYTHWQRQYTTTRLNPDPNSIEHQEPWPGGRTNHYFFDLNRDWAWQSQLESQNRMKQYLHWLPHIHVDFHEMGYTSPYYFAPAAKPYHTYLTDWQRTFQYTIGENHAKYFAENGWLFYTREVFDLLYPSYGDTYPLYHGAIGMTYEQGGSGRASRAILLPTGDTLTLHDRVAHHVTTALSTVEIGSQYASDLIEKFTQFYNTSRENTPGRFRSYLVSSNNPGKINSLKNLLDKNQITYGYALEAGPIPAHHLNTDQEVQVQVSSNDLVIDLSQPFGLFTQILFEGEPELEDSVTYDITAWSIGLGYGLDVYGLENTLEVRAGLSIPDMIMQPLELAYAYALRWGSSESSKVVSMLLNKGISLRVSSETFTIEDKTYPPGSILILRGDNQRFGNKLSSLISAVADGKNVDVIQSSWMQNGPDFGSNKMRRLQQPKVLAVIGDQTNSNSAGQVWYYLEQRLDYPVTLVDWDDLNRLNLIDYNTLILPEGSYSLSETVQEKVSDWINGGGKVIALGRANRSLVRWEVSNLSNKDTEEEETSEEGLYADRYRRAISNDIPGAIIEVELDTTHPLTYGLNNPYFSLKASSEVYDFFDDDWNIGKIGADPISYGFIGQKVKKQLPHSLVLGVQQMGRGHIIHLIDNPLFRAFWEEGNILMDNALFLVW